MNQSVLLQIEDSFNRLSMTEQLLLIERLVHQVHEKAREQALHLDDQLALMAADPEVQEELRAIEREFAFAESDGLENV